MDDFEDFKYQIFLTDTLKSDQLVFQCSTFFEAQNKFNFLSESLNFKSLSLKVDGELFRQISRGF